MQWGRAAGRRTLENNCKSDHAVWDEQLAVVRWKTILNLIKHAAGEAGRRTMENYCKSNQMCSWGKQLAALRWKTIVNLVKRAEQLATVRWKTIVNLIKPAFGGSSWPPYEGKQL